MDMLSPIVDILVAGAAVFTIGSIFRGYDIWKKQQRAQIDNDLAFDLLVVIFKLRDAFTEVRNPDIPRSKKLRNYGATGEGYLSEEETEYRRHFDVYDKRLKVMKNFIVELAPMTYHARILWSGEINQQLDNIRIHCRKLEKEVIKRLLYLDPENTVQFQLVDETILFSRVNEGDGFAASLDEEIKRVENYLESKLLK